MIARCEYCRQITEGVECRKCGAPLPFDGSPEIEVIIPDGCEIDWSQPGGGMMDYSRRNNINNAIQMVAEKLYPAKKILEHLGEPDPEGAMKEWVGHNIEAQRGMVNWRIHGETNEPGGRVG